MAYIEYRSNTITLPIQNVSKETTSLIVPLTVDTLLLI
jgi:hypothetical protein